MTTTKEKEKRTYDDYVQLYVDEQITLLEFVEKQADEFPEFDNFLKKNNLKRTDESALAFMKYLEKHFKYDEPIIF